ncbi:MAG TPA: sensor domain-containing diguanylate cyclase, partial [Abditibacterium sp.]
MSPSSVPSPSTSSSSGPLPAGAGGASTSVFGSWREGYLRWISPLWIVGLLLMALRLVAVRFGPDAIWISVATQGLAALSGAGACFWAIRVAGVRWNGRMRLAWACIGSSALFFALGWAVYGLVFPRVGASSVGPTAADGCWMVQQPLLWIGLFLLAWRGRNLSMMRLLTDTLIVVLSAVVLSWSLILERRLASGHFVSVVAKTVAIYYPVFDIAHLFCALMLLANLRGRPALTKAAGWLLLGVACLIFFDSFTAYFFFNRLLPQPLWLDCGQIWSYLLMGGAALVHARLPAEMSGSGGAGFRNLLDDATDIASPGAVGRMGLSASPWDQRVVRWHRSLMLWLPYVATLGVSGVLIWQELQKANSAAVQRLLPVLALLLAIVARQMMTLWDNLHLAERLRASNLSLERNVDERTRHLATLHGITSTLNTSLDRRTVLRVTLEKTIAAVGADGGGIWLRDARRDIYTESAPGDEWTLVHWQGLEDNSSMPSLLRDIAIASVEDESGHAHSHLSPATREALRQESAPPPQRLILVPVRWQGDFLGVMGLVRSEGSFSYQDRALVESVALEAGTALQNARLYSEAAHRADRDSVTELFNHRAVQELLGTTLARCKRTGDQFSIVMMDLNNFKFFNDTYGHPVGDDVLRVVANGLKESCRVSDTLGRYGGDEFIMVLPDTDAQGTIEACGRIKAALDARYLEPVPGTKLPITIAFGWAAFPTDGDTIHELLTHADANLYNHKRGGASYLSQSDQTVHESREELKRLKNRAFGGSFGVLDALVTAIDNKDHYTRHHSEE